MWAHEVVEGHKESGESDDGAVVRRQAIGDQAAEAAFSAHRFAGASGTLRANGGNGDEYGGGGGGGRIAVWRVYDTTGGAIQTNVNTGTGSSRAPGGSNGTVAWGWLPPPGTIFGFR
ncbi:MAG: hypothetical protein L6455_12255 [Kiritimatiellae bacterium]|nr:hypothetical protein [Kiritimatiellia bacterium]